jgi:hypothetical protein
MRREGGKERKGLVVGGICVIYYVLGQRQECDNRIVWERGTKALCLLLFLPLSNLVYRSIECPLLL